MPLSLPSLRRRDPWWDLDGKAAKRRRLRTQLVALVAFLTSLSALGGAGWLWAATLGLGVPVPHLAF